MKRESGQVLVFTALFMMTLVMLFLMMFNVGTTIRERIRMQNAVDSAAQAAALWHARGLNLEAHLNIIQDGLFWSTMGAVAAGQFSVASKLYDTSCKVTSVQEKVEKYFPYIAIYSANSIARKNGADWAVPININMASNLGIKKNKGLLEKLPFEVPGEAYTIYELDNDKYWFPQEEKGVYLTFLAHKKNLNILGAGLLDSKDIKIYTIATAKPRFEKGNLKPGKVKSGWGASLIPVKFPGDKFAPIYH